MKTERDLQGEGGGGTLGNLSTSTTSVDIDRLDQFKGSNDFIRKFRQTPLPPYLTQGFSGRREQQVFDDASHQVLGEEKS
jgi:hypothetical protein